MSFNEKNQKNFNFRLSLKKWYILHFVQNDTLLIDFMIEIYDIENMYSIISHNIIS